eukprot:TRINITY_DN9401_c0_g1_i1.p1 TRINITY_DN9401_c0_g1~~TRINITY_DN9401_c0_g1_i1.p1  ORF type:complete len:373 (+),score=147.77 TRINITY_DN9401_c0_g1_i1:84-1121(+)
MTHDVTRSAKSAALTVDPLVMFCILDHFTRRDQGERVIGTLLGSSVDGVLEVRSCFPVPHTETDGQLMFDLEYFRGMQELHQRVCTKDVIVGWYATGVSVHAAQIHEHYAKKVSSPPLHLLVDPELKTGSLRVKALISTHLSLSKLGKVGPLFKELPFEWKCHNGPAEKVALDAMIQSRHGRKPVLKSMFEGLPDQLPTDDLQSCMRSTIPGTQREARDTRPPYEKVHRDLLQVKAVLDKCVKYCDSVIDGHETEDAKIGRALLNIVQSLPPVAPATFDKLFNATMQDMLMLNYLAKLTKTQVALMERLHVYIPDPKPGGRDQQQQGGAAAAAAAGAATPATPAV